MAQFQLELPTKIIEDIKKVYDNADEVFGEMVREGAECVAENVRGNAPNDIKPYVKVTRVYRTPSDGCINCKVYIKGYIPFSDPNRKYFSRTNGRTDTVYRTTEGVPSEFLANLYEYGRSTSPFPKKPFFRKSFQKAQIEMKMLKKQIEMTGGLLE